MKKIIRILRAFYIDLRSTFTKSKNRHILLVPPAILSGSFGDELMLIAFLEAHKNVPVTLYTAIQIERKDLFENYPNLKQADWRVIPKYYEYTEAYIMGADVLSGSESYGLERPLFKINLLKKANQYGLQTKILGFSLSEDIHPKIAQAFRELLPQTSFYLREKDSYDRAAKFLPKANIHLVADMAFSCPLVPNTDEGFQNWMQVQKAAERLVIAVCPNSIQARKTGVDQYLEDFDQLLQYAENQKKISWLFLYHDIRENISDKDLAENLHQRRPKNSYFTANIRNGIELKSYLQHIDFTISGRMHFGISGYSLSKPMLGITYEGKFSGLQKLFGLDAERTLIFDYQNLMKDKASLDYFLTKLDGIKTTVENNHDHVLQLSKNNFS